MPGQRFGYPVGSHYTGVRGVRAYRNHIRSTAFRSSAWRTAATSYAKSLGRFALRSSGYIGAAALAADAAYFAYKRYRKKPMPFDTVYRPRVGRRRVNIKRRNFAGGDPPPPAKMPRYEKEWPGANPSVSTVASVKSGRHKPFAAKAMSLLKASLVPFIDKWGFLTNTYDATNTFPLQYSTPDAGVTYQYPVYLYELNTAPAAQAPAAAQVAGAPMMVLRRNQSTGAYTFVPLSGRNADDSAAQFCPYTEYQGDASGPGATVGQGPWIYMDWADIRLSVVGPKKTPAKFSVQMIQFTDEGCMPPCFSVNTSAPGVTPTVINGRNQPTATASLDDWNDWNAAWNEYIAHLLGNPINVRPNAAAERKWRTLRSYSCVFQPRVTTEDSITGGTGDTKHIKWFSNVNKTYTYSNTAGGNAVFANEQINPQEQDDPVSAGFETHAQQRARTFLLISAFTPVIVDGTTDKTVSDVACQFDLMVRRKFYFMDHA